MTDGETITQLVNFYSLAIDAKQMQLFDRVFTPDVEADYLDRRWDNLESWKHDFELSHQPYDVTQHLTLNVNWHTSGDVGSIVSQALFHLIRRGFPGGDIVWGGAWYDDRLRMTDEGWRISRRVARVTWLQGNPAVIHLSKSGEARPLTSMSEGVKDGTLDFIRSLEE